LCNLWYSCKPVKTVFSDSCGIIVWIYNADIVKLDESEAWSADLWCLFGSKLFRCASYFVKRQQFAWKSISTGNSFCHINDYLIVKVLSHPFPVILVLILVCVVDHCGCITGENQWGSAVDTECWSNQWCWCFRAPNPRRSICCLICLYSNGWKYSYFCFVVQYMVSVCWCKG